MNDNQHDDSSDGDDVGPQVFTGPGPTAAEVSLMWAVYHETIRRLAGVGSLTLTGAELIRRDLRVGGRWAPQLVPPGFGSQAQLLLNDVAAYLALKRGEGYEDYYRGAGDILPDAPDDASALEGS